MNIPDLYAAFNRRDIPSALALMTDTVSWPKASEGGRVVGKAEIAAYWTRQWESFDPRVEPLDVSVDGDQVAVRVHQVVRGLGGDLLSDSEVVHHYTLADDLVERMDLHAEDGPSAAFAKADHGQDAA